MMRVAVALPFLLSTRAAAGDAHDRLGPHMSLLGLALESTTLEGAQRLLGKAEQRHNGGDAAAGAMAECYVGQDGTTLALISNSEMGGGTMITGYQLVARGELADYSTDYRYVVPLDKRPRCAALKRLSRSTVTNGGLSLGMSRSEVRRLLGEPSEVAEDHLIFTAEATLPMTSEQRRPPGAINGGEPPDSYSRGRWVRVDFQDGSAVAIRASQVSST